MNEFEMYLADKHYLEGIGYFYPLKVRDIINIGEENYNKLLTPFTYSLEILDEQIIKDNPRINKNFDMFFLKYDNDEYLLVDKNTNKIYLELIIDAISLFTRQEVFLHNQYQAIVVGKEENGYWITRDNFDVVADYLLKINKLTRIEVEQPPQMTNDRQRDVYRKLLEGRKRQAEEQSLGLSEIVKYVRHSGKSIISFEEILNMTIYQLYEDYLVISKQDNYEKEYDKYVAGADPKDLQLNPHWIYKVKYKQ